MDSSRPPITDPEKTSEQIVAYLDGELSAADCQELEDRLARDPEFCAQLNSFQQAWDVLDDLPATMADDRFAASTIEMVAVAASRGELDDDGQGPSFLKRPWIAVLLSIGIAFLAAFVVVRATAALLADNVSQASENEQLLDDLPAIERVEIYQVIDSIDFLRALAASDLLEALRKGDQEATDLVASDATFVFLPREDRRAAFEALSADERQSLSERQQYFAGLSSARQQQIRELHEAIEADPDAAQLLVAAERYANWLRRIDWELRVVLADMTPDERLEHIREMDQHDEKARDRDRQRDDVRRALRWLGQFAVDHQREIVQQTPSLKRRGANGSSKRAALIKAMMRNWLDEGEPKNPDLDSRAMDDLLHRLSPETRREVEQAEGVAAQWNALRRLLQSSFMTGLSQKEQRQLKGKPEWDRLQLMLQKGHRPPKHKPDATEESELWDLFNERLTDQERTELEQLPREEILVRLREYKAEHRIPDSKERPRGDVSRPRRGRPGPPPRFKGDGFDGPPPRFKNDDFEGPDLDGADFDGPPPRGRDRDRQPPRRPPGQRDRRPPRDKDGADRSQSDSNTEASN